MQRDTTSKNNNVSQSKLNMETLKIIVIAVGLAALLVLPAITWTSRLTTRECNDHYAKYAERNNIPTYKNIEPGDKIEIWLPPESLI